MTKQAVGSGLPEARLRDLLSRADRGSIAVSNFFTPGERKQAERFLRAEGQLSRALFWGGYAQAERQCLFLLPDFYAEIPELMPTPGCDPALSIAEPEAAAVSALLIRGSGFRKLAHRDYLGSLLGLGLERDVIGDIALQNDHTAVVFCMDRIAAYLLQSLQKIATDTVRVSRYTVDDSFTDGRAYKPITDTVASPRLDCVVAALTKLSREDAQNAIRSGLVEVDFEPEERVDHVLTPPATISVRGTGRFVLRAFDGQTRKGRLRMLADMLV